MFPANYAVLVVGDPGTGMFEFSCYLAASSLKNGDRVVFVEVDPSGERVRKQLRRFGIAALEHELDGRLVIVDCSAQPSEDQEVRADVAIDLKALQAKVVDGMRHAGGPPVRVIFDSITPLFQGSRSDEVCEFFQLLCTNVRRDGNLTATIQRGVIHQDQVAKLGEIADGIVELVINKQFKRFIRILRMKGMDVKPRWVHFDFEKAPEEEEGTMLGWEKEGT